MHTNTLRIKCPLCDERFRYCSSLSSHKKKVHPNWNSGNNKFKCEYCEKSFGSIAARCLHRKSVHPENCVEIDLNAMINGNKLDNKPEDQFNESFTTSKSGSIINDTKTIEIALESIPSKDIDSDHTADDSCENIKADNVKNKCNLCFKQFTINGLKRHMQKIHMKIIHATDFICDFCGAR